MRPVERIHKWEIKLETTRSGGAGGQHVNKTSSAVILRWNVLWTRSFDEMTRSRLIEKLRSRLNSEGELVVRCEESRSQLANRTQCYEKLNNLLVSALHMPKARKKTRPTKGSVVRRRQSKEHRSKLKSARHKPKEGRDF